MLTRLYHPEPLDVGKTITLTAKASQHCFKVLRLKEGQQVALFCGDNHLYLGTLNRTNGRNCVHIDTKELHSVESPLALHLGQGLARHDRMDWIIQKAVECGVQTITPLMTEKSIVKLKSDRISHKMDHWQQIIFSACEQSGRTQIPKLMDPMPIQIWIQAPYEGHSIVFEPEAKSSVKEITPSNASIRLLLGPESGLSEREIKEATKHGFLRCHLGPRILRTETATIAALTAVQTYFGDM